MENLKNKESTELLTDTKKTPIKRLLEFAFEKDPEGTVPDFDLPSIKTDLKNLDLSEDVMVWFGHSSLFIQISGKKVLVDPVFSKYLHLFHLLIRLLKEQMFMM